MSEQEWQALVTKYRLRSPGHDEQGQFVRDDECQKVAAVLDHHALELLLQSITTGDYGPADEARLLLALSRQWLGFVDIGTKTRGFTAESEDVSRGT